jgi:RecA/RadA recombinase
MSSLSLLQRLKAQSTVKESAVLTESKLYNKKDMIPTPVPMFNVALSGSLNGGLTPGLTTIAGPSKHFKTGFVLLMMKSYLDKYPDAVVIFYDSEFGTPQSYFKAFGIDTDRILHVPITDMEVFKFDLMNYFNPDNKEGIKRNDHVFIAVDSLGNLASRKEIEDAEEGKSTADMTRAKQGKSIFRMVTPHLVMKDIPMVVVQHIYMTQEKFSKAVVSGGTGLYYSSDTILIIGRQQDKDGTEVVGYDFIINVEKSRYVKEKSKIPVTISFTGGMSKWSGLFDLALEGGWLQKTKRSGYFVTVDQETGVVSEKAITKGQTMNSEFWIPILTQKKFQDYVEGQYKLGEVTMLSDEQIAAIYDEIEDVEIEEVVVVE